MSRGDVCEDKGPEEGVRSIIYLMDMIHKKKMLLKRENTEKSFFLNENITSCNKVRNIRAAYLADTELHQVNAGAGVSQTEMSNMSKKERAGERGMEGGAV